MPKFVNWTGLRKRITRIVMKDLEGALGKWDDSPVPVQWFGPEHTRAVPLLATFLGHPMARIRCWAAEALDNVGAAAGEAAPELAMALRDVNRTVRCYASSVLAKIGPAARP